MTGRLISAMQPSGRPWIAGGSLLAYAAWLMWLSHLHGTGTVASQRALWWLAGGSIVAGALYLLGLVSTLDRPRLPSLVAILLVALLARVMVWLAPPLLETDYHRYLWDGAVAASGMNPYRHAPGDVLAGVVDGPDATPLEALAVRGESTLQGINHPHLTTIYPPLAQAAFAAAHWAAPFHPAGLRLVFLLADIATVALLIGLLRVLALPVSQIAWYAWNPILLREVYSGLHMDVLLLPLIAGALLAMVRFRWASATWLLAAATSVKVWPVLLVPLALRALLRQWQRLLAVAVSAFAITMVLWLPVLLVPQGELSGFIAYGQGWQNNDGFFRAGIWMTERVLTWVDGPPWRSHAIMRFIAAGLMVAVVTWKVRSIPAQPADVVTRSLFIVAAVFLLSPTQFPWYWLWCLPTLMIRPRSPLMLYVALLPLYYVHDQLPYPSSHWIQHGPVWSLLVLAWWQARRDPGRLSRSAQDAPHA